MQPSMSFTEDSNTVSESLPPLEESMKQPTTEKPKRERKPRTPKVKQTYPQEPPTSGLEKSGSTSKRKDVFDKLEEALTNQLAGILGFPMMLINARGNEALSTDVRIVDLCLPNMVHQWVMLARVNKTVNTWLHKFVEESAIAGVVSASLMPVALIYMNHANIVPPTIFNLILTQMAAGGAPDHSSTNGSGQDMAGIGTNGAVDVHRYASNQES